MGQFDFTTGATPNWQINGTLTVGSDGAGHDVTLYGDTAGAKFLWDADTDTLILSGGGSLNVGGGGTVTLSCPVTLNSSLGVAGAATFGAPVTMSSSLGVAGTLTGAAGSFSGGLNVAGLTGLQQTLIYSSLGVAGLASFSSIFLTGNMVVGGTVDGIDISAHDIAITGVHGAGANTLVHTGNTIADLTAPAADFSMNSNKITSVTDPASAQDAATKNYVDTQVATANEFTELTDTPANYTGDGLKLVRVNTGETALEFMAQSGIDHGSIGGLGDDDHTQYIKDSEFTADEDILVGTGAGAFTAVNLTEQTLLGRITAGNTAALSIAQVKTLLGAGAASGLATLSATSKVVQQPASISDFLEASPTDNESGKAPDSNWAFDHNAASTGVHGAGANNFSYDNHTHALTAGATDVTATYGELNILDDATLTTAELNLLDLSAQSVIAGELLVGTGNGTAAWQKTGVILSAPDISGSVSAASALTLPAHSINGKLTAGANEIEGSAFDINGGTMAGVTLDGTLTTGGQILDAGSVNALINTTGASKGLKITSTQDGTDGVELELHHAKSAGATNDYVGRIRFSGKGDAGGLSSYAMVRGKIENAAAAGKYGAIEWWTILNSGWNVAMTLSSAGALWIDENLTIGGTLTGVTTLTATTINAFSLGGKLTAGANEIEGSTFDINGCDISAGTISGDLTWSSAQTGVSEFTFSAFPITPSAPPDADYEVANKKYVDDNITGGYKVDKTTVNYDDGSPVTCFTIPAGSIILYAAVEITTAFAGTTPTLDIGDSGDADGLIPNTSITATSEAWYIPTANNLGADLERDTYLDPHPVTSNMTILCTIGGSNLTAGVADVYVIYVDLSAV